MNSILRNIILLFFLITSCASPNNKSADSKGKLMNSKMSAVKRNDIYELIRSDKRTKDTLLQVELYDSSKLTHIKNQFYKSISGHLYERTWSQRQIDAIDTLVSIEYFNGNLIQGIDPLTFIELDGWYAKDHSFVYYYRPTSGGMISVKLKNADPKTFEIVKGEYEYGIDKQNVYKGPDLITRLNPKTLKIIRDKDGQVFKLVSGAATYRVD